MVHTVMMAKYNKAPGLDEITADMIKLIEEEQIHVLLDLYNTVYNTEIIPIEWLKSTFITLPKKTNVK